jgi:hypothetical protein
MPLTKVQAEGVNLADTFAFSGTVTGAGKILQIVTSGNISGTFDTSSETYQSMGCNVAITPSSTSSKIMVWANVSGFYMYGGQGSSGDDGASGAIYRGSTEIYGSNQRFLYHRDTSAGSMEIGMPCVLQVLDSPSSTSEQTYHLYMRAYVGSTINASGYDRSIIAMEIA